MQSIIAHRKAKSCRHFIEHAVGAILTHYWGLALSVMWEGAHGHMKAMQRRRHCHGIHACLRRGVEEVAGTELEWKSRRGSSSKRNQDMEIYVYGFLLFKQIQ